MVGDPRGVPGDVQARQVRHSIVNPEEGRLVNLKVEKVAVDDTQGGQRRGQLPEIQIHFSMSHAWYD